MTWRPYGFDQITYIIHCFTNSHTAHAYVHMLTIAGIKLS